MELERFRELAEAYGADPRRWPAAERGAAPDLLKSSPAETRAVLSHAAVLDAALDDYMVATPDARLRGRIMASAPTVRAAWQWRRIWWQGVGFAGLGAAGVLTGALLIASLAPLVQPQLDDDASYAATVFDEFTSGLDN